MDYCNCARLWIQHLQPQGDCWESLGVGDISLGDPEENPWDLQVMQQQFMEVNGSMESFQAYQVPRENQLTVEDIWV